jgi:hypothetical protein
MLERLAQNELSPKMAAACRDRIAREGVGEERLAQLRASDEAFHLRADSLATLAELRRHSQTRPPSQAARWPLFLAATGAMALALIAVRPDHWLRDTSGTRIKGLTPVLVVYRRAGHEPERLSDGDNAAPGDEVQLAYAAAGRAYGAILSVDGRGVVTLHFPSRADAPPSELKLSQPAAGAIGAVALPRALALDDAPEFERFFFVTSGQPFDLGVVLASARALAQESTASRALLELPTGIEQTSVLLRKGSR